MSVSGSSGAGSPADRRKLVAVMHADMVGYSRLIGLDDEGTLDRLRDLRRSVTDPAIAEYGGRLVQTGGDSLLVIFDSIDGAVRCALAIQEQVPIRDAGHPTDRAIRFRIGINIGDTIADGTDLHGDAVNVAARLQAECPVGGICVSQPVRDHVQDRLSLPFQQLGPIRLKNIARPVEAFVLPQFWSDKGTAPPSFSIPIPYPEPLPCLSVVILPFRTLGRNAGGDDLAEALANDLTTELARIPGMLVIARGSALTSGGQAPDFKRIGQELRVRYAVEGTVRQLGNRARVSIQLIATSTSEQIWADRFDESLDILTADSDAFVRRISTILDSRMLDAETARGLRERPHNPDAHDLLLRAWSLFKRPIERRYILEASELLEQALRLEPNMVPAILSLADRLIHRFVIPDTIDWGNPELVSRAADLLAQVEQTEPNDEWLLFFRGSLLRAGGHWREASLLLRRLLVEHPNNYAAHRTLARCEMIMGHPAEAIMHFERGANLDPLSPSNSVSHTMIGHCLLLQGKASEAIEPLLRGLSETSDNERRSRGQQGLRLASAHALMGDLDRATIALERAYEYWAFGTVHSLWPFYEPRGLPTPAYANLISVIQDGLRAAGLREYANETTDFGVAPSRSLWPDLIGRTPLYCPGTVTIHTAELAALLEERLPILIDVGLCSWGKSLPNAIGMQGAGYGSEFSPTVQDRFKRKMIELASGDLATPIVTFCANSERFTGYNLALRLVSLGCTNVYWYRGGVEAWQSNNLPVHHLMLHEW